MAQGGGRWDAQWGGTVWMGGQGEDWGHQHPTAAVTPTQLCASITLLWTHQMRQRQRLHEHRWRCCCHPHPIPTSVPTARPRPWIASTSMHPLFLTWGIMTIRPISSPDIVIPDDDDDPRSPFLLHPLPSTNRRTTIRPWPPFLIVENPIVMSISPHDPALMLNSIVNPCTPPSPPPAWAIAMGSLSTPNILTG